MFRRTASGDKALADPDSLDGYPTSAVTMLRLLPASTADPIHSGNAATRLRRADGTRGQGAIEALRFLVSQELAEEIHPS